VKLGLRYEAVYHYEEPVSFSPHDVRLFPRADRFSRVRRLAVKVNGKAAVRFSRDVFDNVVASCFFPARLPELRFDVEIDLDLAEKDAFDFILEGDAVELPFVYNPDLARVLAPFVQRQTTGPLAVPGWTPPAEERKGTVSSLVALVHALHESVGYQRREEGAALSPAETLRLGRGACRDVAVLLAEVLRAEGLAARLVSGYLRENEGAARRAEGSLHAWTEVFLPGAGWVGLDATNGVLCNHNFIAAAVGLLPADITPIAGSFYHERKLGATMTSRLQLLHL
jgi:transglutaminase-like putative cysteine protease